MKTFVECVLAGEAQRDDIDDFIDRWHLGNASCSLAQFLGMSDDEYALWVENPSALDRIIQAHAGRTATMASSESRLHVFVSYSHKDAAYLERLVVHLRPFERAGLLDPWSDTRIQAGADWQQAIDAALQRATAAILLISADFLASDFIHNNELPPLLSRARTEGVNIIPVILKPCAFTEHRDLAKFQSINDIKQPVVSMNERDSENLWYDVAKTVTAPLQERGVDLTFRQPHNPTDPPEPEET